MKNVWLTSVVAGVLAFGATWMLVGRDDGTAGEVEEKAGGSVSPEAPPRNAERVRGAAGAEDREQVSLHRRTSEEYRKAWQAIGARRLGKRDRQRLQREIFSAWAEVDLESAIEAALDEPWDGGAEDGADALLGDKVLLDRSEDVWRMIKEDRFGELGSAMLLKAWSRVLGAENPEAFLGYLPELKGIEMRNALREMVRQVNHHDDAVKVWKALTSRADLSSEDRELIGGSLGQLGGFLSVDDLRAMIQEGEGFQAEAAVRAMARKLRATPAEIDVRAEIESIPEGVRSVMAFEILTRGYGQERAVIDSVEFLVENEQWEYLGRKEASQNVAALRHQMEASELAEWVAGLPQREETVEILHRGVEPFIQQDREAAWEWISGLEGGLWRDRAFAEYSQQALNHFNDPEASREALEQIQDPEFKATAEKWRGNWEQRTGWKP